ncbi:ABC transporter substrate-binding protein [Synechococcus sp. M16CYN]|uniref:ABC transporter substrate-binding protein n=1 Tax=Synechococcus sp. M16CYN TaxID=3103139 RepID=UPI0032482F75
MTQASCQPNTNSDRITVAFAGMITSLDPAQASTTNNLQLLRAIGDPLYTLSADGTLRPCLAASKPELSDDGLNVIIPLRTDVLFHDGSRFDAEAMAFSLRRFLRIGTLNYVVGDRIKAVEVLAPNILGLQLNNRSTSLESLLTSISLTPLSPQAYAKHKNSFLHDDFVGTGAYRLTSFNKQHQRLEPFERYWGKSPSNSGINLISLSNSTALFGALQSGEIDVLLSSSIDEDQRYVLNQSADQTLLHEAVGPAMKIGYITLLSNAAPFRDRRLRQAIALSIDREEISERVSYGLRRPLRSLIPPGLPGGTLASWPKYNPKRAESLLRQSGFCQGKRLEVPLTFRSNVPADKLLALTWQAQVQRDLSNCLELKLNGVESTAVYRRLSTGAFKAVILDWLGSYPDPEAYLTPLLSCTKTEGDICVDGEAAVSGSFWTSPGLQMLLKRSDSLRGISRETVLNKIERLTVNGAAYIPVWLESPRSWSQPGLKPPKYDRSGFVRLSRLQRIASHKN